MPGEQTRARDAPTDKLGSGNGLKSLPIPSASPREVSPMTELANSMKGDESGDEEAEGTLTGRMRETAEAVLHALAGCHKAEPRTRKQRRNSFFSELRLRAEELGEDRDTSEVLARKAESSQASAFEDYSDDSDKPKLVGHHTGDEEEESLGGEEEKPSELATKLTVESSAFAHLDSSDPRVQRAAVVMQKAARRWLNGHRRRVGLLRHVWTKLDHRQELELHRGHRRYEKLKNMLQAKLQRLRSWTCEVLHSPRSSAAEVPAKAPEEPVTIGPDTPINLVEHLQFKQEKETSQAQIALATLKSAAFGGAEVREGEEGTLAPAEESPGLPPKDQKTHPTPPVIEDDDQELQLPEAPPVPSSFQSKKQEAEELRREAAAGAAGLVLEPESPMTMEYVTAMLDFFRHGWPPQGKGLDLGNGIILETSEAGPKRYRILPRSHIMEIIRRAHKIMDALPNVVEVTVTTRLTVVGDIHGQLDDVFEIITQNGLPSERNTYLFNGDFVDRGIRSVECLITLLALKILFPNSVFLNRGNHEARDINTRDGFERECLQKYDAKVFDAFSLLFGALPLAHVISGKIFVVHGGMAWQDQTIEQLNMIERRYEIPPWGSVLETMLWSDPQSERGRQPNTSRGCSCFFGPDVTKRFLELNNLQLVIRSHEVEEHGSRAWHDGLLLTVFSASNYCGTVGNDGAYVNIDARLRLSIVRFYANTIDYTDEGEEILPEEELLKRGSEVDPLSQLEREGAGGLDLVALRKMIKRPKPGLTLSGRMKNDVLAQLAERISSSRLSLQTHWDNVVKERRAKKARAAAKAKEKLAKEAQGKKQPLGSTDKKMLTSEAAAKKAPAKAIEGKRKVPSATQRPEAPKAASPVLPHTHSASSSAKGHAEAVRRVVSASRSAIEQGEEETSRLTEGMDRAREPASAQEALSALPVKQLLAPPSLSSAAKHSANKRHSSIDAMGLEVGEEIGLEDDDESPESDDAHLHPLRHTERYQPEEAMKHSALPTVPDAVRPDSDDESDSEEDRERERRRQEVLHPEEEDPDKYVGAVPLITRKEWAVGLWQVLGLDIPWFEMQDLLGLPRTGAYGHIGGPIDYQAFLLRFRPLHPLLETPGEKEGSGNSPVSAEGDKGWEALRELLSRHGAELESVFRHFDMDGSGFVSVREFREGVLSLRDLLLESDEEHSSDSNASKEVAAERALLLSFSEADLRRLCSRLDADGDGRLSYEEFFSAFRPGGADPDLRAAAEQQQDLQAQRNLHNGRKFGQ